MRQQLFDMEDHLVLIDTIHSHSNEAIKEQEQIGRVTLSARESVKI